LLINWEYGEFEILFTGYKNVGFGFQFNLIIQDSVSFIWVVKNYYFYCIGFVFQELFPGSRPVMLPDLGRDKDNSAIDKV
jgi:hypothetical protein